MIKRSDYTSEMWAMKREIDLAFNALFIKQDFRSFIVSKVGYCPRDLNFDTEFEDDGSLWLFCCQKHYGFDSSSNKGQEFSDLGDYETECLKESEGEKYWPLMCDYVNEHNPGLSDKLCELNCSVYW